MATIVNTPAADSGSNMGMIVGLLLLAVIVGLFFIYGIPALRQTTSQPSINVPDKINVNVNPGSGEMPDTSGGQPSNSQ